jgi:hypothetical protein
MTFGFSKQRRRQQLKAKPFPAAWRSIINRNFPIFADFRRQIRSSCWVMFTSSSPKSISKDAEVLN